MYSLTVELQFTNPLAQVLYDEAANKSNNHKFKNPNDKTYLIDEIQKVASSKIFNEDPSQYMLDWLNRTSVRKKDYIQRCAWKEVSLYLKELAVYTEVARRLIKRVKDFKDDDGKQLHRHVVQYIEMVAVSRNFNKNPQDYMTQWRLRRGNSEEFRFLEDPSIEAISKFLKTNL